jgi:hypothetical protein
MIAQSTQELVQCAKQLKGRHTFSQSQLSSVDMISFLGTDFVDPDDPACIAENELFNAAQSIESAAKKLSYLKPRQKPKVNMNI